MEIIWHGHACFELRSGGYSLVLDPYCHRELCGYPELSLEADGVLCSHSHYGGNGLGNRRLRTPEEFLGLFEPALVRRCDTDRLELGADTPAQVALLAPPRTQGRC